MHVSSLPLTLLAVACALQHSLCMVHAARDPSCDDSSQLSAACTYAPHDPSVPYCKDTESLVIRAGCFVCVDSHNCEPLRQQQLDMPKDRPAWQVKPSPPLDEASPVAAMSANLALTPVRGEHDHEQGIPVHPQQAAAENAVMDSSSPARAAMQDVSNWYFLIPTCLALVSMGIALRNRMQLSEIEFERVDGEDDEEINPFCSDPVCNPQHDDNDLEYGTPVDNEDSDDEPSRPQ